MPIPAVVRIPPWPLFTSPLQESERLRALRGDLETREGPPVNVWREVCLAWLARLEASKDRKLRRLADIEFEETWALTHTWKEDQQEFYGQLLDEMRRLDISRVRPGASEFSHAHMLVQFVRQALDERPIIDKPVSQIQHELAPIWRRIGGKGELSAPVAGDLRKARSGTQGAITLVAAAMDTTPASLRARFTKWGLDPGSDDMAEIPSRDPSPPVVVDFEPLSRKRRRK